MYLKPKRCETNSHFHITSNSDKITKLFVKDKRPDILAQCIHLNIKFCLTTYQPIYFSYRTAVRSQANATLNICVYFMVFWAVSFTIEQGTTFAILEMVFVAIFSLLPHNITSFAKTQYRNTLSEVKLRKI